MTTGTYLINCCFQSSLRDFDKYIYAGPPMNRWAINVRPFGTSRRFSTPHRYCANIYREENTMQSDAATPDEYIASLPEDRKDVMTKLRSAIKKNLPKGFEEGMGYGNLGWVVPHKLYPPGYHCDPKTPLPFLGIASQKNHIAVYHMGIYSSGPLLDWFNAEWPKHSSKKLDMGKSCIRFRKPADVPVALIGELASKMTPQEWIDLYESVKPAGR